MRRTTYIIDTSVLIHDPHSFESFKNNEIVIPVNVLDELDKLKTFPNDAGKNARVCIRILDRIVSSFPNGDLNKGIKIENNILFKIDTTIQSNKFGDNDYVDNKILACAELIKQRNGKKKIPTNTVLVSRDINLRIRARAAGVKAETYEKDRLGGTDELYQGFIEIVNEELGNLLSSKSVVDCFRSEDLIRMQPNECVHFINKEGRGLSLGKKVGDKIRIIQSKKPWGLDLRNKEQAFATELLMDKKLPLVTLIGMAGTGKTIVALAAALEMVGERKDYNRLIIYRPIQPVGKDIGYLPGPQPLDAKILTPNGWTTMGEIDINNFVIGSDGTPKKVLKTFSKGIKDIYRIIFSDGSSTECCDDHLWFTTTRKEEQRKLGVGSVKSLKEIRETLKVYTTQMNNHKIPMIQPVQFNKKEHIIHPYILGIILGDGCITETYSVNFTSTDPEVEKLCHQHLPTGMKCKLQSGYKYGFIMNENEDNKNRIENIFNSEINRLNLRNRYSSDKFIPKEYLISSIEDRLAILQGLMDSDGFVSEDGSDVSFSTTSSQLAIDIQFIIQSLGGKANINDKISHDSNGKEIKSKVVSVSLPDIFLPFQLSRKLQRYKNRKNKLSRMIELVEYVGKKEAKCILVDSTDHLYATDHFILTHNTMEEKLSPWMQAIYDNLEVLFGMKSGPNWKRNLEYMLERDLIEMEAITYIRGRSIPNSIILIDEAQNLSKEEIKTILTRAGTGSKIILTGDIQQIDNTNLDVMNNGLTYIVEKFKELDIAGHITFTKGERSVLATKASEIL